MSMSLNWSSCGDCFSTVVDIDEISIQFSPVPAVRPVKQRGDWERKLKRQKVNSLREVILISYRLRCPEILWACPTVPA